VIIAKKTFHHFYYQPEDKKKPSFIFCLNKSW